MKSENYRQLLNNEKHSPEMTAKEYDNTLMHFAMLYHQEQIKEQRPIDFVVDIIDVCKKHRLSIAHEDIGGAFIIEHYKEDNIEWFKDARFKL